MGIYGHKIDNYLDNQVLTEGFLSKLFSKLKKKPLKIKIPTNTPKYDMKKIKEKFEQDFKLTNDIYNSGFDIFDVVKSKEDFNKVVKNADPKLYQDASDGIFYIYCYLYDIPDNDPSKFDDIIEAVKQEYEDAKKVKKNPELASYEEYADGAIQILTFAKQKKLLPITLDTDSTYYNKSDKKFYTVDYKGRTGGLGTIEEVLEDRV